MAMSSGDMSQYEKGMEIYEAVAAKTHPKYAEDAAKAKEDMALYTNNMVAKMQAANDFDGIIKMADDLLAKNPQSALAQNVRLQAYANKKDYAKVIELGPVSYTHLDVYKRQARRRGSERPRTVHLRRAVHASGSGTRLGG